MFSISIFLNFSFSPFAEANSLLYDWHIHSLPQAGATAFWQFLFVKHQTQFASHHVSRDLKMFFTKINNM
jgi:hypothetical protein